MEAVWLAGRREFLAAMALIVAGTPKGLGSVVPGDVMDCFVEGIGFMRVPVRPRLETAG